MAEGTIEAQEKILLDSKDALVKQLGEMIKSSDLDLKERKSARQQRDKLIKGNNNLAGDLKKNYQDFKDGITTTVDGFINETFGPFSGVVSSISTGFFKRNKEAKDAKDLQLQELEAAKDMVGEFQGQKGGTAGGDLKRTADAVEDIADNMESAEDRRERLRKSTGGGAGAGKDEMKTSEFEFGGLTGGLTALSVALGAAGGLAAPGLFQLQNFPKIIENFKTKTAPKLNKIFGTDFETLTKKTETWGNQTKNVVRNAKGQFVKVTDAIADTKKGFPTSFDDLATKVKDIGKSFKMLGAGDEVAGLGGKFATVAKTLATGVAGRALSIAGNPVFSYIAMGKDVFDVASAVTDDDVKTSVKNEDIGGLIGGFIGGAIGIIGGPAGVALGMGLGNMAGEFIGGAMDAPEVLGAIEKVRNGLSSERAELVAEIAATEEKLKDKNITESMKKQYQLQLDAYTSRVTAIDAEVAKMDKDLGPMEEELKAIEKRANDAVELKKSLEKQLALAEKRGDDARVKMLEDMIENADKEFEIQEKAYEDQSEKLRQQAAATSEGLKDNVLSFFGKFTSLEDNPITNFFGGLFGGGDGNGTDVNTSARGGIIVNRPTYLPSSGTVIGEHGTYTGRGAARGGIPLDGGPEAVIPLTGNRAQGFIQPLAASIAGATMNQLAMDRVGLNAGGGMGSQNIVDSSSTQIVNNNTIINPPKPSGPMLPGAGRDTAVSHFRHVA